MKDKIRDIISNIGGQIETYSPLVSSTGYVISRLDVKLLFGLIPSITPFIKKVSDPDIHQMIVFLKADGGEVSKIITNSEAVISKLEEIELKVALLKSRALQLKSDAGSLVTLADNLTTQVHDNGLHSMMQDSDYSALMRDAILLLAGHVKSPILAKLLAFVAKSIGGQSINFKGYEMKEFSLDLGIMPSVSFSLVKV